jgi:LmbE family N-acetylglucosaminyl deacetylase
MSVPNGLPGDILRGECLSSLKTLGVLPDKVTLLDYEVRTFPTYRQEILESMIELKKKIKPDLVLLPSSSDIHQDHSTIYHEALRAFKKEASIWGYEHPWNNLTFTTDIFIRLKQEHLEKKIKALKEYKSQNGRSYFDERYLWSLAYTRGAQVDLPYAEAFELVRLLY